jgi:hypothetical protein
MRSIVDPEQMRRIHIRVALRRRDRGVTEQLLDSTKVGAGTEQVRREAVA